MKPNVHGTIKGLLTEKLEKLEAHFNADMFVYYGPIYDNLDSFILNVIEELKNDPAKKDKLCVVLTTTGGSSEAVERYVNIIRSNYSEVDFIIPDKAYSAGTIFCMSGDSIYMDYFSVLGPIDPQVQNKEGRYVAALGYLDKVNEMIEKSRAGTITQAEFLMIKDLDLAELRSYEQAKELTTELLKKWLVQYKFKNWNTHRTTNIGDPVTPEQKQARAEEIAKQLGDNTKWKTHSRPINIETLKGLRLDINDYTNDGNKRTLIRDYYDLLSDYVTTNNFPIFIQTRKYI